MTGFPFDRDYDGPIHELGNTEGHHCFLYYSGPEEYRARCSCDATWTYGKHRTLDYMISIYVSHLAYFKRKPTETL